MAQLQYTPISDIPGIRDDLRKTFRSGVTRSLTWRRNQLYQLAHLVQDNADALAASISADLGRPSFETILIEAGSLVDRALESAAKLEEWAKPIEVGAAEWQASWKPTIHKQAKGVILVIAPWNYPLILSLQAVIGAIAAGCPAVLKPSEIVPTFSALIAELVPKYLDISAYRVVNGSIPETTKLLELQWDHIFYTGNGHVGRIVAAAAAKHLTPVTLELGGKSPVIIDGEYDLKLAAKRTLYGKMNNAGQICVAPDYVLIPREKQDEFIEHLRNQVKEFYPDGPFNSPDYSKIVSPHHFARLRKFLEKTKGQVAIGGEVDEAGLKVAPTVVRDVKGDDVFLDEEIFGPILPIIPVTDVAEAIEFVNARDHALVIYAFTENAEFKKQILAETNSGNISFNDTFNILAVNELPFGGVGESGYGRQVLKYTFDGFSYERSTIDVPASAEPWLFARYPPYTEEKSKIMIQQVHLPIPKAE